MDVFGLDTVTWMDPSKIEQSHSIKATTPFRKKSEGTVSDLANILKKDPEYAKKIEPIQIAKMKGKIYSANNKRLKAFKMAGIDVPTVPASKKERNNIKSRIKNCK